MIARAWRKVGVGTISMTLAKIPRVADDEARLAPPDDLPKIAQTISDVKSGTLNLPMVMTVSSRTPIRDSA